MHSFHRSRGRILFEVFCAIAISASCVGTWMQTGAWALLPAASVAALYGLVRALDLAPRKRAITAGPKPVDFVDQQDALPVSQAVAVPLAAADQPATDNSIDDAKTIEPTPSRKKPDRRAKVRRKGGDRRAKAPEQAKVSEPAPREESEVSELELGDESEAAAPVPGDEVPHTPPARLFEPEPFVRQQRAVFGRKAG